MLGNPTTQTRIQALGQVQRRAARFVTSDYTSRTPGCVTKMQEDLGWDTLQGRQHKSILAMLNQIDHQLMDVKKEHSRLI